MQTALSSVAGCLSYSIQQRLGGTRIESFAASVSFPIQFGNVSSPCFLLGEGLWLCEELQTLFQSDGTRLGGTGRGILPAVLQEGAERYM